ncbi:hippurate hydrolase [Thalassobaculum fulvum]|jgi:hippurate hydrolase|uniref:Hippurate hydrolase n=2 Tax=Thalassobaculum fulvum TaxID=1633335 RepID=A0A918XPF8_9PROT|nr:hippurate hydrolase [Thalassobaculum fulvum]
MPVNNRIAEFHDDMTEWRRDFHAHPEIKFEEHRTAARVAEMLQSWGIEVHTGIAGTGVVGVLRGTGSSGRAIGLRADMDALPMDEEGNPPYRSQNPGRMHACGHDGHTTMLLGAARYLAETRNFDGTVNFIFQPAEEGGAGARIMIEEGLFDRFPCDTVWGIHNAPHMPAGTIGVRPGPLMAGADQAFLTVKGKGAHAARPHDGIDPIAVGVQLYQGIQTVVSRNVDPLKSAVVTVAQFHAGTANNVIPHTAELKLSIRTFDEDVRSLVEQRIRALCEGVGTAFGCEVEVEYRRGYSPVINPEETAGIVGDVAEQVVGAEKVERDTTPIMASEDFAFMLAERPGAFLWLGGGAPGKDYGLHHPMYDFNDEVLPVGASFWAKLVETQMPRG